MAANPGVPMAMALRVVSPAGNGMSQSARTRAFCAKPPHRSAPTRQPVSKTLSPGLKRASELLSTVPAKSQPGMCG